MSNRKTWPSPELLAKTKPIDSPRLKRRKRLAQIRRCMLQAGQERQNRYVNQRRQTLKTNPRGESAILSPAFQAHLQQLHIPHGPFTKTFTQQ